MPPQKSKGRTGLRSLEDNALLLLVFAISLAFAWILWPFFGALLWAAVLAIVFTPLHEWLLRAMPKRQNLPALATVLIILTLVILPLTLIAAALVQEAANFHENMQGGSWNPGAFFQQFLAVLPSWATDLLDRLGLKDLAAVQAKLSDALGKGSVFFASEALDIGLGTINFLVSFAIMLYLLFFFVRDAEGLTRHYARHSAAA
jgi:predicted PurR-regulated permease PerM